MAPTDYLANLKREIAVAREAARAKPKEIRAEVSIRDIRAGLRLSQSEFAKMLGASVKTLQGWEQGRTLPKSIAILAQLIRDEPVVRKRLLPLGVKRNPQALLPWGGQVIKE